MGGRRRADIKADTLLRVPSALLAQDASAGDWTYSGPVDDPHGCHSDAAWWKSSFVLSSFFPQTISISLKQQCRLWTWALRSQELPELLPVYFASYTSETLPHSVPQTESTQLIITCSILSCPCCSICNLRSYCKGHIAPGISYLLRTSFCSLLMVEHVK